MQLLSVSEKILAAICGFGIFQGILLAALVYFHPKADRSVNRYLSLYIACTTGVMLLPFIIKIVGWQSSWFIQPLPLISGPLLYLYLRSFSEKITWKKILPHLVIPFLYLCIAYWNIHRWALVYPESETVPANVLHDPVTILVQILKIAQMLLYFFLSRRTLATYRRSIKMLYSDTTNIDLKWATFLVNGFLVLILVFMIIFPMLLRFPQYFETFLYLNMAVATPYIYIATYKGVMQHTIWQVRTEVKEKVVEDIQQAEEIQVREDKQPASDNHHHERLQDVVQGILQLMEVEKLYQETELTLNQLASRLQVPAYQVSLALNEGLQKNFYDLVNGYRVEEAKRLLVDNIHRNFTILSVGFEAGFNSKTTFNTVFKKFTGLTPSEYRNKQLATLELATI